MASAENQKTPEQINLELHLLDNPSYSSEWIASAVYLITKCSLTEEECCLYNADQLENLISVFTSAKDNSNIDINKFFNPKLNSTQMQIIITGYSHGLTTEDLKMYFNPDIPYAISNWGITALCDGYDINEYVKDGFNKDQLCEIYSGLKDGVDVTIYDKKELSASKMAIARHALVLGLNVKVNENKELTIY